MKRLIAIMVLVLALMLAVCACAPAAAEQDSAEKPAAEATAAESDEAAEEPAEPVELRYVAFTRDDPAIMEGLIAEFEAENPGVTIVYENQPDTTLYYNNLRADVTSGAKIDIFDFHPNAQYGDFINEGLIADISDLSFNDNYVESAKNITSADGKNYGYLNSVNMIVCWYNKATFAELGLGVPNSFQELVTVVKALKEADKGGIAYLGADVAGVWLGHAMLTEELGTQGIYDFWKSIDDGSLTNIAENSGAYAAMKTLAAINTEELLYDNASSIKYDQCNALFATGKASLMMQGTWEVGKSAEIFPGIEYGLFAFPTLNKANVAYAEPGQITCAYAKGENVEYAKKFIDYLARPENASTYVNAVKTTSTISGVSADFTGAEELVKQMEMGMEILPVRAFPNNEVWDDILTSLYKEILFNTGDADKSIAETEKILIKSDFANK